MPFAHIAHTNVTLSWIFWKNIQEKSVCFILINVPLSYILKYITKIIRQFQWLQAWWGKWKGQTLRIITKPLKGHSYTKIKLSCMLILCPLTLPENLNKNFKHFRWTLLNFLLSLINEISLSLKFPNKSKEGQGSSSLWIVSYGFVV